MAGGLGAVSTAYASICPDPSLLSSHSVDWSEMPEACQVSVMTVTLEDGDSDSDGSDMEWASQEAMGKVRGSLEVGHVQAAVLSAAESIAHGIPCLSNA